MRLGPERVGRLGLLVLGVTGVVGVILAVHGYGRGLVPAGPAASSPPPSTAASPTTGPRPAGTSATASSSRSPGSTTTASAPTQKLGPLLSSTQYAPYAFEIYPGVLTAQARVATTGFHVNVSTGPTMITVHVSVGGSSGGQSSSYALGDRVYFVETSLGDDSGSSDYNLGDDGILVTDHDGRIVQ